MEELESQAILDTDVIIDYLRKRPEPDGAELFRTAKAGKLIANMTSITVFELCRGARLSPDPERSMEEVKVLRSYVDTLPSDGGTAEIASEISVSLEKKGSRWRYVMCSSVPRPGPMQCPW